MAQGIGNTRACRIVGINERTGRDWARGRAQLKVNGRTARVPDPGVGGFGGYGSYRQISARFLSDDDRIVIADLRRAGHGVRDIAQRLDRSPSTVSRELKRNCNPTNGQYHPHAAQRRAEGRRSRPKGGKIAANTQLREFIQDKLIERWSPEQIARVLRDLFPTSPEMHVSHETIYQALYVQGRGELRRELTKCLRTGRAMRKPQRSAEQRTSRFIDPMLMISERPAEIEDRAVPGHWEGDLIIGKNHQSAIGTLVERQTRFVMLLHLPNGHDAAQVAQQLTETMSTLPEVMKGSVTWDQGSEMAAHKSFTMATNMPVYFCDPASPWQRGSNENTNGLLRQYFPKGTDLQQHTAEELRRVADQLNARPRKTLGWKTPAERLSMLLEEAN
ncbi:MAG: IS30 family transposase [Actinomycetota bacterium]